MDVQTMNNVDHVLRKEEVPMLIAQFWQQRAAMAEREALNLKEQLAATHERAQSRLGDLSGSAAAPTQGQGQSTEEEAQRRPSSGGEPSRDKESNELVEDLRRLQSRLAQMETHTAQQRAQLLHELETKKKTIQRLQHIIEQQKDYSDIKKGIVLLKSMKGGGGGGGGGGSEPEQSDCETGVSPSSPADTTEIKTPDVTKEAPNDSADSAKPHAALHCEIRPPLVDAPLLGFPGGPPCLPRPPLLPGPPPFPFPAFPSAAGAGLVTMASRSPLSPPGVAPWRRGSISPPERATSASTPPEAPSRATPDHEAASTPTPSQLSPGEPHEAHETRTDSASSAVSASAVTVSTGYRYDENDPLIPKSDPMETRLQEMLRYNMDKYAHQNLDTLQLARRVRELLSSNNIGQRMFARYILGLSQGTVSELLSKPKTWEKLTEKGRDSYRKMHAWAVDEAAVGLLKAVIPKRGKDASRSTLTSRTPASAAADDPSSDDRISHILTEAQQAMRSERVSSSGEEKPSPAAHSPGRTSPASEADPFHPLRRLGGLTAPGCTPTGTSLADEHPQERIARLYREHLTKMMSHRPELAPPPFPGIEHYQRMRSPEEMRLAMDFYNQELLRQMQHRQQQQQQQANGAPVQDLSGGRTERRGDDGAAEAVASHGRSPHQPDAVASAAVSGSGSPPASALAAPLIPGLHPAGFFMHSAAAAAAAAASATSAAAAAAAASSADAAVTSASPLQRMASITNSLMTAASMPTAPPHSTRTAKAVLPPITQQQFDHYNNLNTEEIVARIKEHLSRFSLSQRLFGESVLGLSQGSVSDLLARPKPWHMLTQKGREPFIRMRMFLDDESAVHKLVASQYKIAPEKLMRTGCFNGGKRPNLPKLPLKLPDPMKPIESPLPAVAPLPQFHGLPPAALASRMDPTLKLGLRLPPAQLPVSVYETAAITPELDTMFITTKVKEVLLANNIGQKLFGEAVLGLSQGSVSELLSKPKPWHLLSIKGREPFIRMKLWLEDGRNVEKLQRIKAERREGARKRRCGDTSIESGGDNSGDGYSSTLSSSPTSSAKKSRVLFTEEQKEALQLAFALDPYPNMASVEFLCQELGLTHRTITNWFHNHRMRMKQAGEGGAASLLPPGSREGAPLEPLRFRLLLHRRLQELHREKAALALGGAGVLPPALLPFPYFGGLQAPPPAGDGEEHPGGLDLSMKSEDGDRCSDASGDLSGGSSPAGQRADDVTDEMTSPVTAVVAAGTGSSRRKPSTPQWVAPQWHTPEPPQPAASPALINGVCVMQTDIVPAPRLPDDGSPAPEETEPPPTDMEPETKPETVEEPNPDSQAPAEEATEPHTPTQDIETDVPTEDNH